MWASRRLQIMDCIAILAVRPKGRRAVLVNGGVVGAARELTLLDSFYSAAVFAAFLHQSLASAG